MINYNPKDWFTFIFRFHKADTFRQLLPLIAGICIYSGLIAFIQLHYWHLPESSHLKNIPVMHSLLGFVISMLLVFRTNTAYDRWWEGRKLWGSLVNNSRNLAIKLAAILPMEEKNHRNFFRKIIPAYAYALKNHLGHESTRIALFETGEPLEQHIQKDKHIPNQVAVLMINRVNLLSLKADKEILTALLPVFPINVANPDHELVS